MITLRPLCLPRTLAASRNEGGFTLAEFLIASFVLILVSAAVFDLLTDIQKTADFQIEAQAVLDNTRIALDTIGRYIRQAGNDPHSIGLSGITMTSPTEFRIVSDLTGSTGTADPDKGDPDGDVLDTGEDVLIRYNTAARTIEVVSGGGSAQTVTNNISACSFQFYGPDGSETAAGAEVRRIKLSISGTSAAPSLQTGRSYGFTLSSDIRLGRY